MILKQTPFDNSRFTIIDEIIFQQAQLYGIGLLVKITGESILKQITFYSRRFKIIEE